MAISIATKFKLGKLVMTRGVNDRVAEDIQFSKFALDSLRRHARGDWGDMSKEDKEENELALRQGNLRVFSSYALPANIHTEQQVPKIWIITEADRSATTILFPEEY